MPKRRKTARRPHSRRQKKIRINWRALRWSKIAVGGAILAFIALLITFAGGLPDTIAGYKTMYLLNGIIAVCLIRALFWVDRSRYFDNLPPVP